MIDFHCHVDLFPDPAALIREITAEGIYVLAVTTTPKSWPHLQTLLNGQKRIKGAIGLHPELVADRASEVAEVCAIMSETRYVGEIGLDGSPQLSSSFALQQKVFDQILSRCAELGGRVMSIHSRSAASAVLDALEKNPRAGTPVLHWFSGSAKELDRAVILGSWFSVGPAMLGSAKGRRLLEGMPKDKVLTESDGPFAKVGTAFAKPQHVAQVEKTLAELWHLSFDEVGSLLLSNFRKLVTP